MRFVELPGVATPVSRLVMGTDNQPSDAHARRLFDDFVEHGGNAFDTAWNYDAEMCNGDHCESRLGRYLAARCLRSEVVLVAKGAHTPDCHPEAVRPQLLQSLDRLGTDHADVYLLHRDNPEVPVGEFVDALNQVLAAGLVRTFGVSNWSRERFDEAQGYAQAHGIRGPAVLSNHYSLAEMAEPLWEGSHSAADAAWRAWLTAGQTPLIGWSSLSRGFLAGREDRDTARVWHSERNLARRARLWKLAEERGVHAAALAIAFVLAQPFPTLALIGPRTLAESHSSLAALSLELADEDVAFLLDDSHPARDGSGNRDEERQ